jgi:hypothetical protein
MKISSMDDAARRVVAKASQTTGGTFVLVGWNGTAIVAGDKVLRTLPHVRVDIANGDSVDAVAIRFAVAVAQIRKTLPAAIKAWTRPPPPKPTRSHGWSKPMSRKAGIKDAPKKK